MASWVRAGRYDLCLEDVGAVKRLSDGRVRVYLRNMLEFRLLASEAEVFLPRWERHAGLGVSGGAEGDVAGVVEDVDEDLESEAR